LDLALHRPESLGIDGDLFEWTNAWNQCTNLRHLEFEPRGVEDFQVIFATPKNHLISVEPNFDYLFEREDVKTIMVNLEIGTRCVERLTVF